MMTEPSIMERIRESSKSATSGIDEEGIKHWTNIYIMGKSYRVPAVLTIMQAMEFAGYRFVRGAGCRAGFCGACTTIYRTIGDYKLKTGMACQTRVEDGMYLVQLPFFPAENPKYDMSKEKANISSIFKHFPEIARCVSCNSCTKACPQDIEVMECVQALIRGDIKFAAENSFDCVKCGLCAARCPADIVHYNAFQFVRRLHAKYEVTPEPNLKKIAEEVAAGKFDDEFARLNKMDSKELIELYRNREIKLDS
jgi:formate hydrogenlyase subunit 6/NADH:ubiquinone oxidoreductase subunit I